VTSAEIIETIGERLASAVPAGSRVILFGSQARGEASEGSDFDVLVIEPSVSDRMAESARLRRELREFRVPIDVLVVDQARARVHGAVPGTVIERAIREGRTLANT
jgi:predicted nucleotidyltransferase